MTLRVHLWLILCGATVMTLIILCMPPTLAHAQSATSPKGNPPATSASRSSKDPVVVKPGDSLWSISQERLGPKATLPRIDRYVGRLYALNRDQIGADPDLIFVGQQLSLPPLSENEGSGRRQAPPRERPESTNPKQRTENCKPVDDSNGEIAFQEGEDIWTMKADGSDPVQLTDNKYYENAPAWSPDGKKIAFTREIYEPIGQEVVVIDADGCNQVELPVPEGKLAVEPTWSPDGKKIAYVQTSLENNPGDRDIYIANADGSGVRERLTIPGLSPDNPEWSPDGTQIAFNDANPDKEWTDIYVVDVSPKGDASRPQRLTDEPLHGQEPSWSPNGTSIVFHGFLAGRGDDIYKMNANIRSSGASDNVFGAIGCWLRKRFAGDPDRACGFKGATLTNSSDRDRDPTWSPDGKRIAFVRDDVAPDRASISSSAIYVMRSDGSAQTLVRKLSDEASTTSLDWRPQRDQGQKNENRAQAPHHPRNQTQGQDLFTIYTHHRILPDCACVDQWYVVGEGVRGEPAVSYNHTGRTASHLTIVQPQDMLNLHPGPTGQKSVVRWTAPTSATVNIEGEFAGLDTGGTTTDVAVIKNTVRTLFSDNINDFGDSAQFSTTTTVAGGDTIDFSVGYGRDATYENDSTGLSVTISSKVAPGDLQEQTAVGDFSATVNPSGAWSYGYRPSAASDYDSTASSGPSVQ